MKAWLVGGAVRDRLLGLPVKERDWVVTGASEQQMLAAGYRRVGHDFPVFLHPATGEEHALARQELKSGLGHTGFVFDTSASVRLEDDLLRRDLTINAMAEDADGRIIDPHGGQRDLAARVLRHVSPAFAEDPLRVLRVARFAARFHALGFSIAPETCALMRAMAAGGELSHLTAERVFAEVRLALGTGSPQTFVRVLRDCGALAVVLPEVDRLFGVPQPARYHPEIDTGEHVLLALEISARLEHDEPTRFAVLVHDLGKALTDPAAWPSHVGHEELGAQAIAELCDRLRVPARWRELAIVTSRLHTRCHRALEMQPAGMVRLLEAADAFRQPERFGQMLQACEADARGRTGLDAVPYAQAQRLRVAFDAAATVSAQEAVAAGLRGEQIRDRLHQQRCAAVRAALPPDDAQEPA